MTAVLIILAIMSVPLSAVISRTYLKAKKLNVDAKSAEVALLLAQNAELERRVSVLESIAIDDGTFIEDRPVRIPEVVPRAVPRLSP